ncbi:MAG: type IV pilin protein [Propionivibrio sp.]
MIAKSVRGFTLMELMIVVVVVAILAAIAYPSYMDSVRKSRRSDGKSALLATSQAMERYFTENTTYNGATITQGSPTGAIGDTESPEKFYKIEFDSAPTGGTVCGAVAPGGVTTSTNTNPSAYRLCATPTGAQSSDTCGVLSLSSTGETKPTTPGCWKAK